MIALEDITIYGEPLPADMLKASIEVMKRPFEQAELRRAIAATGVQPSMATLYAQRISRNERRQGRLNKDALGRWVWKDVA